MISARRHGADVSPTTGTIVRVMTTGSKETAGDQAMQAPVATLPELFAVAARRRGTLTIIADRSEELSVPYEELVDRASRWAVGLAERGVERGDRVCLLARSSFDFVTGCQAIWRRGATVVPLPPTPGFRSPRRRFLTDDVERKATLRRTWCSFNPELFLRRRAESRGVTARRMYEQGIHHSVHIPTFRHGSRDESSTDPRSPRLVNGVSAMSATRLF